eukprot:Selendium_serpulae@DN6021_c0_g1_i11.p1
MQPVMSPQTGGGALVEQASAGMRELIGLVSQGDDAQYFDEEKFSEAKIRKQGGGDAAARSAVVWIIGQYQREIPFEVPDVLRTLALTFGDEESDVKLQILNLGFKVWGYHWLNKATAAATPDERAPQKAGAEWTEPLKVSGKSRTRPSGAISEQIFPRLDALFDYVCKMGVVDENVDVRDVSRAFLALRQTVIESGDTSTDPFAETCRSFVRARCSPDAEASSGIVDHLAAKGASPPEAERQAAAMADPPCPIYSLAQVCSDASCLPLPLPPSADAPSALRDAPQQSAAEPWATSICNSAVRAPVKSTVPKTETVQDLEDFYNDDSPEKCRVASVHGTVRAEQPPQAQYATGSIVLGEDPESDEEHVTQFQPAPVMGNVDPRPTVRGPLSV